MGLPEEFGKVLSFKPFQGLGGTLTNPNREAARERLQSFKPFQGLGGTLTANLLGSQSEEVVSNPFRD